MSKRESSGRPQGGVTLPEGGGVYVHPGVDPAAAYAAGITARRGGLPKADLPLERPRPPIPHIEGGPGRGDPTMTMADYARAERAENAAYAGHQRVELPPGSIIQERPRAPEPAQQPARQSPAQLGLLPADLLPEQAKDDPGFRQGHGSEYACNQPELALRYGIIRKGQFIPPQKLGGPKQSSLRPETVRDLEALHRMQSGQIAAKPVEQEETEAQQAVENGIGGSAGRIGGATELKSPAVSEDAKKKLLSDAVNRMDAFEFNQWRQLMMQQVLHSEEEREAIESRLKPLDLGELLANNVIRQRIPIIPGKYEITLQSYDGQVELALKRLVMQESRSVDVGEQYLLDKHSFMSLTVGLHKINDKVYPDIVDENGVFSDDLFLKKFNMVMRLPIHMLASIGVNLMWFEMRVRRLYSATAVGNG